MKIILHSEEDLEFLQFEEPGMEISAADASLHYSALQMFASSLALCTYSMLASYGDTIDVDVEGVRMRLRWSYADKPFRVDSMDLDIEWPGLPESRLKAAQLAASHCTIHHTLEHPPRLGTVVRRQ